VQPEKKAERNISASLICLKEISDGRSESLGGLLQCRETSSAMKLTAATAQKLHYLLKAYFLQ